MSNLFYLVPLMPQLLHNRNLLSARVKFSSVLLFIKSMHRVVWSITLCALLQSDLMTPLASCKELAQAAEATQPSWSTIASEAFGIDVVVGDNACAALYLLDPESESPPKPRWSTALAQPRFSVRIGVGATIEEHHGSWRGTLPIQTVGESSNAFGKKRGFANNKEFLDFIDETDRKHNNMARDAGFSFDVESRSELLEQDRMNTIWADITAGSRKKRQAKINAQLSFKWRLRYPQLEEIKCGGEMLDRVLVGLQNRMEQGGLGDAYRIPDTGIANGLRVASSDGTDSKSNHLAPMIESLGVDSVPNLLAKATNKDLDYLVIARVKLDGTLMDRDRTLINKTSLLGFEVKEGKIFTRSGRLSPLGKSKIGERMDRFALAECRNIDVERIRTYRIKAISKVIDNDDIDSLNKYSDPIVTACGRFLQFADKNWTLSPNPIDLDQDKVKQRLRLLMSEHSSPLQRLAEAKYYRKIGLLSANDYARYAIVNIGKKRARALLQGDIAARKSVLHFLLVSNG